MKKTSICLALALIAVSQAGAQNIYDAMTVSENQYFGTARSMGLGNAITALGGDIGMTGINPAGGAVAGYSQIEITPGVSIAAINSAYCPSYGGVFGAAQRSYDTRFVMPSGGVNLRFDRGRATGLRNTNLTIAANTTNLFSYNMDNTGLNSQTSKFAEFATAADGVPTSVLTYSKQRNMWDVVNAFEAGTICTVTDKTYMGASEYLSADSKYHYIPGELSQNNVACKNGYKTDILVGLSGNISDRFYIGLNLGLPIMRSQYYQAYKESAVDPKQFPAVFIKERREPTTYFNSALYEYNFASRANGAYGKLGFLAVPVDFLRVGVAISTPTSYSVTESWQYAGQVTYQDTRFSTDKEYCDLSSTSYSMRGSWEVNAGVALVAGSLGLLSLDYEMTDYSHMQYFGSSSFDAVNQQISYFCGVSHNIRAGLEIRAGSALSLRAGWNLTTCPEKYYIDQNGTFVNPVQFGKHAQQYISGTIQLGKAMYYANNTSSYSLGAGYNFNNGLFIDLVARMTRYPGYEYYPYYDYKNYDKTGTAVNVKSPVINCSRELWTVALTVGHRF